MTPSTICAGFKKSGVFPFNPEAIDCGVSVNETHVLGQVVGAKIGEVDKESDEANKEGNHEPPVFSAEQQLLFQTRLKKVTTYMILIINSGLQLIIQNLFLLNSRCILLHSIQMKCSTTRNL